MMRTIVADGKTEIGILDALINRSDSPDLSIENTVREILADVRDNGDEAVKKYMLKYDGFVPEKMVLTKEDMKTSFENVDSEFRDAICRAAENIRTYHEKQIQEGYETEDEKGSVLGQIVRGLSKVGIYVPGGTAAYPSTVLMNAIPAKIAKVEEVIMVTPPAKLGVGEDGICETGVNSQILAAAYVAGVDKVILSGGAQAVAALAYGTEIFPRVDKIVGPGNIFVATAKRILYGLVDIDMIAGPSEILIIADKTANPTFIAADLLSQAEHDKQSAAILLTTDDCLAKDVALQVEKRTNKLSRKDIAEEAIKENGIIIICSTNEMMTNLSNMIAPEHLEILTKAPRDILPEIKNAGSVFLGPWSPEPLGDYYSGTNHVLPTSGTARYASPLGVYDFIKRMSYTQYSEESLRIAKDDIIRIGKAEGLTAHVESIKVRFEE